MAVRARQLRSFPLRDGFKDPGDLPTSIATIQINATAPEVYRFLATPHLISEWASGLKPGIRVGGDSEIKLGLRSPDRTSKPNSSSDPEIISFSPDHSVSVRIESAGFIMHARFHLFESDGVTTVRQSVKLSYKRWYRMFAMITNRSVHRRISGDLQNLKARVERDVKERNLRRSA